MQITVGGALESDKFLIEVDEQCIISENVSEEAVIVKAPSNLPRNIQMVTVKRQGLAAPSKKGKVEFLFDIFIPKYCFNCYCFNTVLI